MKKGRKGRTPGTGVKRKRPGRSIEGDGEPTGESPSKRSTPRKKRESKVSVTETVISEFIPEASESLTSMYDVPTVPSFVPAMTDDVPTMKGDVPTMRGDVPTHNSSRVFPSALPSPSPVPNIVSDGIAISSDPKPIIHDQVESVEVVANNNECNVSILQSSSLIKDEIGQESKMINEPSINPISVTQALVNI